MPYLHRKTKRSDDSDLQILTKDWTDWAITSYTRMQEEFLSQRETLLLSVAIFKDALKAPTNSVSLENKLYKDVNKMYMLYKSVEKEFCFFGETSEFDFPTWEEFCTDSEKRSTFLMFLPQILHKLKTWVRDELRVSRESLYYADQHFISIKTLCRNRCLIKETHEILDYLFESIRNIEVADRYHFTTNITMVLQRGMSIESLRDICKPLINDTVALTKQLNDNYHSVRRILTQTQDRNIKLEEEIKRVMEENGKLKDEIKEKDLKIARLEERCIVMREDIAKIERANELQRNRARLIGLHRRGYLLPLSLLIAGLTGTWAQTCNYDSSGMAVQSVVCNGDACTTVWTGSGILMPGESKCFNISNTTYEIYPRGFSFSRDQREVYDCMPLTIGGDTDSSCTYSTALNRDGTLSWGKPLPTGPSTHWECFGDKSRWCNSDVIEDYNVQVCPAFATKGDEVVELFMVAGSSKSCYNDGCGPNSRKHFGTLYCLDPSTEHIVDTNARFGSAKPILIFKRDGREVSESENFTASSLSSAVNPFEGVIMARNLKTKKEYVRRDSLTLGDPSDLCAVTISDDRRKILHSKAYTESGSCAGSSATKISITWTQYAHEEMKELPYTDPLTDSLLSWNEVISKPSSAVALSWLVRQSGPYSGTFTKCEMANLRYQLKERDCPSPDYLILSLPCTPYAESHGCSVYWLNSSDDSVIFSIIRNSEPPCNVLLKSTGETKNITLDTKVKTCVDNPLLPYDSVTNSSGGGGMPGLGWFGLAGLWDKLVKVLTAVVIAAVVGLLSYFVVWKCFIKKVCESRGGRRRNSYNTDEPADRIRREMMVIGLGAEGPNNPLSRRPP
uniref:Glycoprotein n=2 Tax=Leptomonas pyrrhocoris leishbunyavirus 4 TaxID=3070842 RepID=A0AA50KHJ8_9VIRU|nr:glycoprotein [Leptomonas pyrrhocoris leishbunyavirus 4]